MKIENIKRTGFNNPKLQSLGIEPVRFGDLKSKLPAGPEQLGFYMLLLVESGEGRHRIDFIDHEISSNSFMFVRPGQVQEWVDYQHLSGQVILIDPLSLPHEQGFSGQVMQRLSLSHWSNVVSLSEEVKSDLLKSLQRLHQDFNAFSGSEMDMTLIRHELLGLLLRMARWFQSRESETDTHPRSLKTYELFQQLLEVEFMRQHNLNFYARRLGYAESTLSRACIRAEGVSAKRVIDQRIILEAKRMLVHSPLSVAEIGYALGFSEATNFNKFFRRLEQRTPQMFREQPC